MMRCGMPGPRQYVAAPVTKELVEKMDAALAEGEVRLDLFREAIERELKRRERMVRTKENDRSGSGD